MDSPAITKADRAMVERRRLTPDREALIRDEHSMVRSYAEDHNETMCSEGVTIGELLDEIDALRADWDEARANIQTLVLREPADSGRRLLEIRIREIVATSKGMGLSRGTCETLCNELLSETSDEVAELYRSERKEDMRRADAAGYARATKDAQAYVQFAIGMPQAADDLEGGAHVGAAEKYADEICADSMERELDNG